MNIDDITIHGYQRELEGHISNDFIQAIHNRTNL